jgi:hypothetical protein
MSIDRRYGIRGIHRKRQAQSPGNLQCVAGNMLSTPFASGSINRIYSSAVLPHIIMTDPDLARESFHNVANLLREGESIAIAGFDNPEIRPMPGRSIHISSEAYHADPQANAESVVNLMLCIADTSTRQRNMNIIGH